MASPSPLERFIEATHHLGDPQPPWDTLLNSARQVIGGDSATFILFDPAGGLISAQQEGVDAAAEQEYVQYYHAHDLTPSRMQGAAGGSWFDTAGMQPRAGHQGEREYLDYMHRHRMHQMVGLIAIGEPDMRGYFTVQRSTVRHAAADWSRRADMQQFSTAIQTALASLRKRRQDWMTDTQATLEAFGDALYLLTPQGRVLHASPAAQAGAAQGLHVRQGMLWHPREAVRTHLHAVLLWVAAHQQPASLPLPPDPGSAWRHADLAPAPKWTGLSGQAPILMRLRPAPANPAIDPLDWLAAALALTPAEARVLAALAQGQTVAEHAQSQGRSVATVRRQVSVLMLKLDCTRQSDLVRKAMRYVP